MNEGPAEAVAREVREEAGLEVAHISTQPFWIEPVTRAALRSPSMFGGCSFCTRLPVVSQSPAKALTRGK